MITVTAFRGRTTRLYPICGMLPQLPQEVRTSQGVVTGTRASLLKGEHKRLEAYRAPDKGEMLPAQAVLNYLDWRDG